MVPFDRPYTISYYSSIATLSTSHRIQYIITNFLKYKEVTWPRPYLFRGLSITHALVLFSVVSISRRHLKCLAWRIRKIWLEAKLKNSGSPTLTMTILGVVCHPKVRTWHSLCAKSETLASTVPEISLVASKIKNGSRDLTTRLFRDALSSMG